MKEVIKSDGTRVPFDVEKIRTSIRRTGAPEGVVETVVERVLPKITEGMTTAELYHLVFAELKNRSVCYSCRYNLRSAILRLGPAGFRFEQYVASILRAHGYDAVVPEGELEGGCVWHEIDGIAEKDGKRAMIEAKFRNQYSFNVNLKDVMATWTRFLDLADGAAVGKCPKFDEVWLITNAKFSDRALKFGTCKGMKLVGWDVPHNRSFARLVDDRGLYPITVLDGLHQSEIESFSREGIMLCREVIKHEPEDLDRKIGIGSKRAEELIEMCSMVVEGE